LEEVLLYLNVEWLLFSKVEFIDIISKYSNLSIPSSNHISWSHLKTVIKDDKCIINFVNITNSYIDLSYWSFHFKKSMLIIILKPNKSSYNTFKTFQPIVFLNTVGNLIEKVIRNGIQVYSIALNFIHPT